MNVIFLCTANKNRSCTAEEHYRKNNPNNGYKFLSAGLSARECVRNNSQLCNIELLEWADKIFVMEQTHKERIQEHTGTRFLDKIHVLEIADIYSYYQPELIKKLQEKVNFS